MTNHVLPTILICDDDSLFHYAIKENLKGLFHFECAFNGDAALEIVKRKKIRLVLLDIQMRTPDEGLRYLPKILEADPEISVIICSQHCDLTLTRQAMISGAVDYLRKDSEVAEFIHSIRRALDRQQLFLRHLQQDFEARRSQKDYSFVGQGHWTSQVRITLEKFRKSNGNILITGETGTGKEIIARQLRKQLPDGTLEPFIAVDSGTIQSSTAESALFGHEKGAFTGADRGAKGFFEAANGGVIYFDEVGNMPLEIQNKLLRVIQEKEIRRLGSQKIVELDFRVIAATNRDLKKMCDAGEFKFDLYQRLNVLPIHVPTLRERTDEIELLVKHFARLHVSHLGVLEFTDGAIELLKKYDWPGNIRELENFVCYVAAVTEAQKISEDCFALKKLQSLPTANPDAVKNLDFKQVEPGAISILPETEFYGSVRKFEKAFLELKYDFYSGNITEMSRQLKMDRSHLYTKLKEYGLHSTSRPPKGVPKHPPQRVIV